MSLIVDRVTLAHSPLMAVRSLWILAGSGARRCTCQSRTRSMAGMSEESPGHGEEQHLWHCYTMELCFLDAIGPRHTGALIILLYHHTFQRITLLCT